MTLTRGEGEGKHLPGGPPAAGGGGAGDVAAAGLGSDGGGVARRVAGPCEAEGRRVAPGRRGLESRVRTAQPAAPHLPPELPARGPVLLPQQHLRRKHQKSTERRTRGGGGGAGAGGGGPAQGAGRGPATPPAPPPAAAVRGAERGPECARLHAAAKHARPGVRERGGGRREEGVLVLFRSGPTCSDYS